jgi:hypothetical protein
VADRASDTAMNSVDGFARIDVQNMKHSPRPEDPEKFTGCGWRVGEMRPRTEADDPVSAAILQRKPCGVRDKPSHAGVAYFVAGDSSIALQIYRGDRPARSKDLREHCRRFPSCFEVHDVPSWSIDTAAFPAGPSDTLHP